MIKVWKIIKPNKFKNISQCVSHLKRKKYILSPWIENIVFNKKNKIKITNKTVYLFKVKVSHLGFKKPVKLKVIYKKLKEKKFKCVSPDIALIARLHYNEQKSGEWLRFATPMKSMIDTDNVPHLPKLGKALGKYFLETYWSYPGAIFHPHNEFIVMKYDI
tara:strand:- start:140 stop:622 length:483 start_codon:yes stop_codon:yes gene_type:complete